jgi:predicted nucleic acid-binding protein
LKTYFLDTSAVVRLYTAEPGAQMVRDLVRSATMHQPGVHVLVCDLARPETVSALRRIAMGPDGARRGLSRAALYQTLPRVGKDFGEQESFFVVPASPCMVVAADIAERHPVKGADAVHIASALVARDSVPMPERFYFVTEDLGHSRVAEAEGLQVLRPAA